MKTCAICSLNTAWESSRMKTTSRRNRLYSESWRASWRTEVGIFREFYSLSALWRKIPTETEILRRMWESDCMKHVLLLTALLAASAPALLGSINGTVVNRTTGKPGAGVQVNLLQPGAQGMQPLGTTMTDGSGRFVFDRDRPMGPLLLQAVYQNVHYDKLLTPNIPASDVELEI